MTTTEKRIDSEDGNAYTWDEISSHYARKYNKWELSAYWDEMKPVMRKGTGKGKKGGKDKDEDEDEGKGQGNGKGQGQGKGKGKGKGKPAKKETKLKKERKDGPATVPAPQDKLWLPKDVWLFRHELLKQANCDKDCQVVFLGDSITEQWMASGVSLWKKYVTEYSAIDLGIGGDEVQHVLWRVQDGILRGLSPKVLVLLIGTNNIANPSPPHKADDIAQGIRLLLDDLRKQLPSTIILLLGVFPRGELPGTRKREKITALNCLIKDYHDGKNVFYLDIGNKFMDAKQIISKDVMPDFLHLSLKGYQIWADAMDNALQPFLGAPFKVSNKSEDSGTHRRRWGRPLQGLARPMQLSDGPVELPDGAVDLPDTWR